MIRGIGTDIVEIDRISNAIKKEFFLKKAFNDSEIDMAKPFIKICNNLNRHLQGIDENKIHVSISNTDSLAIAMVVIETD